MKVVSIMLNRLISIPSRLERSGNRIEGCELATIRGHPAPLDTRFTAFCATRDATSELNIIGSSLYVVTDDSLFEGRQDGEDRVVKLHLDMAGVTAQ